MSNLLNLKNRIRSVKNIGQITKAMELVAATKMKRAQQRALEGRLYTTELKKIINKVLKNNTLEGLNLTQENKNAKKNLLIIIGPSKGLAGPMISNLSREVYTFLKENPETDLITIDKKGAYIGERSGKNIVAAIDTVKTSVSEDDLEPIYTFVKKEYLKGNYKSVSVVFTHFINTLVQKPMVTHLLPVNMETVKSGFIEIKDEDEKKPEILIEPERQVVLESLLDKLLENRIYLAVLDSISSEYSARMIAMKNAGDNARELRDELTLEYNQSRQAAITQQILEIAGAAAAMEG